MTDKQYSVPSAVVDVVFILVCGVVGACCCMHYSNDDCRSACAPQPVKSCQWHRVECGQ